MCNPLTIGSWLHLMWKYLCPNFVHGVPGISCPNWFFFSGHFLLDAAYFKQGWQVAMNCSMSLFIPGQYIVCFASSMHLVIPRCPVCSSFRNLLLITLGMIIHVDFRSKPFSTVNSFSEHPIRLHFFWDFSDSFWLFCCNNVLQQWQLIIFGCF